jgi:AAA+ ATPase superfamily predicted ATPase
MSSIAQTQRCWTKAEIYEYLKGFNRNTVRSFMNKIIAENREVSLNEAKDQHRLRPSEVEKVLKEFA